jgi:hypothetical protein
MDLALSGPGPSLLLGVPMLITVADVQARTGETYADAELARVNAFIEDVTGLVTDFCSPTIIPDPTPASVKAIAAMEVRRFLNTEPGVSQDRVDTLSEGYAYGGAAIALSPGAEAALKKWLRTKRSSLRTVRLVRPAEWDVIAPTAPTDLVVAGVASTSISLSWSASSDNCQVAGYRVYEGSTLVGDVCWPNVTILGLTPSTSHTYQVLAYDRLDNQSPLSSPVTGVTTA